MSNATRMDRLDEVARFLGVAPSTRAAIVGNAQSQFGKRLGSEIDAHDLVLRLNYGTIRAPEDQGSRTDVLGCSDPKITLSYIHTNFHPRLVVWLTRKPAGPEFFDDPDLPLYVNPEENWAQAAEYTRPARPSSGAIAVALVVRALGVSDVTLYGFDFFASRTFYHRRGLRFWRKRPTVHDGRREADMMRALGVTIR